MKRVIVTIVVLTLILGVFTSCINNSVSNQAAESEGQAEEASGETETKDATENEKPAEEAKDTEEETQDTQEEEVIHYEFEFEDVNGNMHKLSDYEGKPVYLEVWGSWCGACMTLLPEIDKLAGEAEDFHVLSVVLPGEYGEKNKEDFIAWFKDLEYKNLTVLLDEEEQIMYDYGISAFPSQIFFDAHGNFAGGRIGGMSEKMITEQMSEIAEAAK